MGTMGAVIFLMKQRKASEAVLLYFDVLKLHLCYIFCGTLDLHPHNQRLESIDLYPDICFFDVPYNAFSKLTTNG